MEHETIKELIEISRISGLVEGLSTMTGAQISKAAAIRLEDAADRLAAYVVDMIKEDVIPDDERKTAIGFKEFCPEGSPDQ